MLLFKLAVGGGRRGLRALTAPQLKKPLRIKTFYKYESGDFLRYAKTFMISVASKEMFGPNS